jgi:penicillin-binding protein 2
VPWRFRDHALFVAYAPAEDPTIAMAVVVEHGGHGGSDAAPVARAVMEAYFGVDKLKQAKKQKPSQAAAAPAPAAPAGGSRAQAGPAPAQ